MFIKEIYTYTCVYHLARPRAYTTCLSPENDTGYNIIKKNNNIIRSLTARLAYRRAAIYSAMWCGFKSRMGQRFV